MKTVGFLFLLLFLFPVLAAAQSAPADLRARLDEARRQRQSRQEAIDMESSLMKSSQDSLHVQTSAARSAAALAPVLHPTHLSLPGRVVMTVMRSALGGPELLPLSLPKPEVVELASEKTPQPEPGVL